MGERFARYELRTTDPDAARAFYEAILGADFWGGDVRVGPLPAAAAARGAPAHWLGQVGVADVAARGARLVEAGAVRLGPALRDPFGAMIGMEASASALASASASATASASASASRVAWRVHASTDVAGAIAWYRAAFGWRVLHEGGRPDVGRWATFTWDEGERPLGVASDAASRPGVHPQWLFFFAVDDLDRALDAVRARGGLALAPRSTPLGDRVAPCDDPQGAAFGLIQVSC